MTRQRQRAGRLDADAVGDGRLAAFAIAVVDRVPGRREALGLHADDRRSGRSAFAAVAMPAIRPPPPIGDDERVDLRLLGEHLERDRALAGDDGEVVERMDEREAALGGELQAGDARVLEGVAVRG